MDAAKTINESRFAEYFPPARSAADESKALDVFYGNALNLAIPISSALRIVGMQATGSGPAEIEMATALMRSLSAEPGAPPK
jgi:hypothetical protein